MVSVKLMQQQKKVVHHRRPQPYVVKLQSSSFQMRLRTGRSHEKHAERMKGTGKSSFQGSSCERPNGRSRCLREQNGVVFEAERPDCSVPAQQQQQQQQQHDDAPGGSSNGNGLVAPKRARNASRTRRQEQRDGSAKPNSRGDFVDDGVRARTGKQ